MSNDLDVDITIKNYRCFSETPPARIALKPGFTAFVGPNNGGKSTILRFFHEFRPLLAPLGAYGSHWAEWCRGGAMPPPGGPRRGDASDIFYNGNSGDITIEYTSNTPSWWDRPSRGYFVTRATVNVQRNGPSLLTLYSDDEKLTPNPNVREAGSDGAIRGDPGRVMMNVGHLLRANNALATAVYLPAFRNALHLAGDTTHFDLELGDAAIARWRQMKGTSTAEAELAREIEKQVAAIFGFREDLRIDANADATSFRVWCDDKTYRMEDMGAGFTQVFLMLTEVARRKPALLLLDEPELNLHASLQLRFLEALKAHTHYAIFYATHNLALARASNARIYSVTPGPTGSRVKSLDETPDLTTFLDELNFAGFRQLGARKLLLVEGKTEIPAVREILRKIGKEQDVVVLSLAGDNMINVKRHTVRQLYELTRLGDSVSAVIDSERSAASKPLSARRVKFARACRRLGINVHVLERRALENYFPQHAVHAALGPSFSALGPFDKPGAWDKNENARIADALEWDEIKETDLGKFVAEL